MILLPPRYEAAEAPAMRIAREALGVVERMHDWADRASPVEIELPAGVKDPRPPRQYTIKVRRPPRFKVTA